MIVREHINELFKEESDPIHDLGIGGINFEEERSKYYVSGNNFWLSSWLDFLNSLKGKKITGVFIGGKKRSCIIDSFESYNGGERVNFYDNSYVVYRVDMNERYLIQ